MTAPTATSSIPPLDLWARLAPFRGTITALFTTILREPRDGAGQRVLFAGVRGGEGVTTVAACAAVGLARFRQRPTTLVEANLFSRRLAALSGMPADPGFLELCSGASDLASVSCAASTEGLTLIPAGGGSGPGSFERFSAAQLAGVFAALAHETHYLLVDAPPVLAHPEAALLAEHCDSAVLVARARRTRGDDLREAREKLEAAGTRVLGVVLNDYRREAPLWLVPAQV